MADIEKTVYLIRHGQSVGNVSGSYQGLDSPLSELGKKQAEQMAERVSRLNFETLISSPLTRAEETASAITLKTGKKAEYSDLFVERVKPTGLGGKEKSDQEAVKIWDEWEESLFTPGMRVEDGENFDDLFIRVDKALDFLHRRPEEAMVVVTHGYFLRAIVARVLLGEFLTGATFKHFQRRIWTENAGISVIKYKQGSKSTSWRLWIYNDHSHLG